MNPSFVIVLLLVVLAAVILFHMFAHRPSLSPQEAQTAVSAGQAVLVDVREPDEWVDGVAAPAVLLPLSDLRGPRKEWGSFLDKNRDKRILLYCRSGGRAGTATGALKAEGFNAENVGGFSDWANAGLPVRRP